MIAFLIFALVLLIVLYVVKLVVDQLDLPPGVRSIALAVVGLTGLILILQRLGVFAGAGL